MTEPVKSILCEWDEEEEDWVPVNPEEREAEEALEISFMVERLINERIDELTEKPAAGNDNDN